MIDYPAEELPTESVLSERRTPTGARVALVTLTNGTERRPATLGPIGLDNLDRTLDEIQRDGQYDAVIVTGNGRTFCAGADLDVLSTPPDFASARTFAREGHRVLGRLSSMGIPVIAAINGTALGGGMELALHCTARIVLRNVAPLGLPEVGLGLIPGWGGTTLLPSLIGWESALRIIVDNAISGRTLTAEAAAEMGVVDIVSDDLINDALAYIDDEQPTSRVRNSKDAAHVLEMVDACLKRYLSRPGNPTDALSRLRAVFDVASRLDVNAGFEAEDDALAALMQTAEFRRRLYAFRVTNAATKLPTGTPSATPRSVRHVGVVGAGLMASQIALAFAESLELPVVMTDVELARLDAARERMSGWLNARVSKNNLSRDNADAILQRITTTLDWNEFADCDLVIEAVFEDLDVKRSVFTQLEPVVPATTVIASNTSSLSVDVMASFVKHSDRVAGIHFFNPVSAMKLVEVVKGSQESAETLATAIDIVRRMGKTPVLVADRPGFVVNRLLSTFLGEVLREVESGASAWSVSGALEPLRLPMTPFQLIDLIGRRVTLSMMQSLHDFAPDRFFVGDALPALVNGDATVPIADELTTWANESRDGDATAIHDRVVGALAREVRAMLDDRVVDSASDIDVCMINGAGWPSAIGGLTPYLDGCGASVRETGDVFHPGTHFA